MRVPPPLTEFLAWRWMPCAALTAGSLAFVAFAVLLIPSQFDGAPSSAPSVSVFDQPSTGSRAIYSASLAQGVAVAQHATEEPSPPHLRAQPVPVAQPTPPPPRGFSPVIERADPPAPPPPEMPPPPAAAPPPPIPPDAVPAPVPPPAVDPDAPHREN